MGTYWGLSPLGTEPSCHPMMAAGPWDGVGLAVAVGAAEEETGEQQHLGTSIIHKMPAATKGERDQQQESRAAQSSLVVVSY